MKYPVYLYIAVMAIVTVMTFPAIIYATASPVSGAAALAVALFFAYKGKSLFQVSIAACAIVFILEFFV